MSFSDTFSEWAKPLRNLQTSATKGIPSFHNNQYYKAKVTHGRMHSDAQASRFKQFRQGGEKNIACNKKTVP